MTGVRRAVTLLTCLSLVGLLPGCKKTTPTTSGGPPPGFSGMPPVPPPGDPGTETGPHAAGQKVFAANGCGRCHAIGGAGAGPMPGGPMPGGPKGRNRGPDLGTVGRDPAHTVEWIMEHIRTPKVR